MDINYLNNLTSNITSSIIEPKFTCFCGCKLNYSSVKKHLRSNKHKILVKAKLFDELQTQLNSAPHTS